MVGRDISLECFIFLCLVLGHWILLYYFLHRKRGVVLKVLRTPTYGDAGCALQKGVWPRRVSGAELQCTAGSLGVPG